jgi:diphthamide biosynthesis protein 7
MAFALEENASNPPSSASAEKSISILSGGDDMYLRSTRIAIPTSSSSSSEPSDDPPSSTLVFQDRRIHTAGVTALLPLTPNLLITGSYDDHIRLVHIPSAKTNAGGEFERAGPARPQVMAELDLGGGVWRIKTLEETGDDHVADSGKEGPSKMSGRNGVLLLVSCMYAGARIVRLVRSTTGGSDDEDEWAFQVDAQFTEHKSMNYGSDVRPHGLDQVAEGKATMKPEVAGKSDSNGSTRLRRTIVSSSFYDKLLCSWYWEE